MNGEIRKYRREDVLHVMQIIRCNGNLMCLETEEFTLSKIVEIFDYLKQGKFISSDKKNGVHFTEDGERLFEQLCRQSGLRGLYKYMIPNIDRRVAQKEITEIYIPTK